MKCNIKINKIISIFRKYLALLEYLPGQLIQIRINTRRIDGYGTGSYPHEKNPDPNIMNVNLCLICTDLRLYYRYSLRGKIISG
jgi:hypothetical protein